MWCHKVKDQRVRTLGQDCVFRTILILGLLITVAIILWILIVDWDGLTFICDSYSCMASMMDVLKLPIAILTAVFAVAGFYAVVFRSQQTSIQIQESLNQNIFKNYLDHKKSFMDILSGLEENKKIEISNKEKIYAELFPFNSPLRVEFSSRSIDSEKSLIIFWVDKFNSKMEELDEIFHGSLSNEGRFVHTDVFARWLSGYSNFLLETHISFAGGVKVTSQIGAKYFAGREALMSIPSDLELSFSQMQYVLQTLSRFCLLRSSDLSVKSPSSVRSNELVRLVEVITKEFIC